MRETACLGGDLTSAGCIDRIALAAGMAIVFANGTKVTGSDALTPDGIRTWNAGGVHNGYNCVSGNAWNNGVDDIAYVRALAADIGARLDVEPKRVFATGFSNGAALTQGLACQTADVFAAIAPVSVASRATPRAPSRSFWTSSKNTARWVSARARSSGVAAAETSASMSLPRFASERRRSSTRTSPSSGSR